ncbi:hypothetical protein VTN96DRAFT_10011 [Rasamsonia emersonii]|uniref:F-box domain protein n=1 Tax=Rasamsonia emersonii (strain ATCC 16479 / CBS 393.64 / IMI 116815) TaxID=1408163 RepID=A0A0F4YP23_RASE3|nr:hypothetical protein T310_5992 [Rasamsonia emersonii CBS 393.64]KKA19994.1 hypothetical protein T310_5992 [Rasamsonia emersonii CBS 393.64]
MAPRSAFTRFWRTDLTRDGFLSLLDKDDLRALRLVNHDFSVHAARYLFAEIEISFRSSTFTRPARMAALERIGRHVKTLTFKIPHSQETFLPPLLDPITGEEQTFVYIPQVHVSSSLASRWSEPKYGSWEMTDLLVKQYPPLFHAATNVPSFVRAFRCMPSLRHLKISCDGQSPDHRYRRSVVDYALISLRVAVEQAPLESLDTLSLLPIHPGGILYLRPMMGFGASPAGRKRWMQIRKLAIHMESFPYERGQTMDHLRLLHSYLEGFPNLRSFVFRWKGLKGPSPLSLATEPCLCQPSSKKTCSMRYARPLRPLKFRHLRYMELENAIMDASQVAAFIMDHRRTLSEFEFEDVTLRSGTWDDALEPLTKISGSDKWKEKQEEVIEVPIILSPVEVETKSSHNIWEEQRRRAQLRTLLERASNLAQAKAKTRELFWGSPDHMKKFLRSSVFSWR